MTRLPDFTAKIAAAAMTTALLGCAPAESPRPPGAIPELAGRTAGAPQTCVSIEPAASLRIVNDRTVLYGSGRTVWVNRLASDCPGLNSMDILAVDVTGSQYCRGDRVRRLDPVSRIPGPTCVLGDFVPYAR
jgi:hypothetical protein